MGKINGEGRTALLKNFRKNVVLHAWSVTTTTEQDGQKTFFVTADCLSGAWRELEKHLGKSELSAFAGIKIDDCGEAQLKN